MDENTITSKSQAVAVLQHYRTDRGFTARQLRRFMEASAYLAGHYVLARDTLTAAHYHQQAKRLASRVRAVSFAEGHDLRLS